MTADNPKLDIRTDGGGYMHEVPRVESSPFKQQYGCVGQAAMVRLREVANAHNLPLEQVVIQYLQQMQ